jgi:hypothetical protein
MGLLRWLTQNHADTDRPTHRDLRPLKLAPRRGEALLLISYEIGRMPRWHVEATDGKNYSIRAKRKSDEVQLRVTSEKGETFLHVESRGRGLIGDFGRNRRNILELFAAMRKAGIAEKETKKK